MGEGARERAHISSVLLDHRPIGVVGVDHPRCSGVGGCTVLAIDSHELRLSEGCVEGCVWLVSHGAWMRRRWVECHSESGPLL